VLQTQLLWDRKSSMHGGNTFFSMRQQVRFLLETSNQPGRHRMEMEDGRRGDDNRRGLAQSLQNDQRIPRGSRGHSRKN